MPRRDDDSEGAGGDWCRSSEQVVTSEPTCRHCELLAGDWCAHCGLPPWSVDHPRPIAEGAKRLKILKQDAGEEDDEEQKVDVLLSTLSEEQEKAICESFATFPHGEHLEHLESRQMHPKAEARQEHLESRQMEDEHLYAEYTKATGSTWRAGRSEARAPGDASRSEQEQYLESKSRSEQDPGDAGEEGWQTQSRC